MSALAATAGRLDQAARLWGASDALRKVIGIVQPASGRTVYEFGEAGDRDAVRAAIGDDAFAAAWAKGRAMTIEQAIEYALVAMG